MSQKCEVQYNLSRRKMYDEYGQIHYCVDETLKRRLQTKLLIKTLNFKIGNQEKGTLRHGGAKQLCKN